jgi:hypothetical protein
MITQLTHYMSALRKSALIAVLPLAAFAGGQTFTGGGYWEVSVPSAGSFSSEAYTDGSSGPHAMVTVYGNGGSTVVYSINSFTHAPGIPDDERASASVSAGDYDVAQVQIGSNSRAWTTVSW